MKSLNLFCLFILLESFSSLCNADGSYTFKNWKEFPKGAAMGIFLAVAIPLDLAKKSTYMAYNFEAIYPLPHNVSELTYPPLIQRQFIYDMIESKMEVNGLIGKACLLRTICEAADHPVNNNGLIGDILHIIFTPSSSKENATISNDYEIAEKAGINKNCIKYNDKCAISILDIISWIGHNI